MRVNARPETEDDARKMIKVLDDRLGEIIDKASSEHPECVEEFAEKAGLGGIQGLKDVSTKATNTKYQEVENGNWHEAYEKFQKIHSQLERVQVYIPDCLNGNEFPMNAYRTRDSFHVSNALNTYSIIDVTKMMKEIAFATHKKHQN